MLTQTWFFFQPEEEGVGAEELQGQGAGRRAPYGVVGAADAQHGHGRLVHVAQRLVAGPVRLPAHGAALGRAEEGFLQLPQRTAAQQLVHVHHLGQGTRPRHQLLHGLPEGLQ
uniref:Uncharacterized protein n=1 Tax=Dromaius novaehollandiae TaxID=8790 RepID=A0A8C4KAL9_DRONO